MASRRPTLVLRHRSPVTAHGTSALIEQVLNLGARPVVYSHGHMTRPSRTTRRTRSARAIRKAVAVAIAKKGGVVETWPLGSMFRTLDACAGALVDAAKD